MITYSLTKQKNVIELQAEEDACIRSLDPLAADSIMQKLPALNASADVAAMQTICYRLLPHPSRLEAFDYYEAAAAMRDLGVFIGSMKRHGHEPVDLIPELDYVLDVLGNKTGLPPRDTLLHYTSWNPDGLRRRTYTGTADEDHLIQSVKLGMLPLVKAIYGLKAMLELKPDDATYALLGQQVVADFEGMINGIIHARRNVSTDYFANELRLYFDAIKLHGTIYLGPGAVEMPMFVYDHLLWSSQVTDPLYNEFKETYLPYILSYLRDTYKEQGRQPSLLDKLSDWAAEQEKQSAAGLEAFKILNKLCLQMKSFRMPHKKVAEEAYEKDKQQRAHGSGGYTTDILTTIIQHTQVSGQKLEEAYNRYQTLPKAK